MAILLDKHPEEASAPISRHFALNDEKNTQNFGFSSNSATSVTPGPKLYRFYCFYTDDDPSVTIAIGVV